MSFAPVERQSAPPMPGCPRLPWAPRPLPDELLASWCTRVARRYGQRQGELEAWLGNRAAPEDANAAPIEDSAATRRLWAHASRIDPKRLHQMPLIARYPRRPAHWFLRDGCPAHDRPRAFPPVCLGCIDEDMNSGRDAYLRATWMLAEMCVCPRHRMLLVEDCLHCARPFTLAGSTRSGRAILVCGGCGRIPDLDLRQGRGGVDFVLEAQDRIGQLVADATTWPKLDAIIAHVWSRCGRNRTRTELDRWSGNTRLWPLQDRLMVGQSHPLAFLTVGTRALVLSAVAVILGAGDIQTIAPHLPFRKLSDDPVPAARPPASTVHHVLRTSTIDAIAI